MKTRNPRFLLIGMPVALMWTLAANAVPISIEFTGTVRETTRNSGGMFEYDPSRNGQTVSGFFLIETEGFERTEHILSGSSHIQFRSAATPNLVAAGVSIGGVTYDMSIYPADFGGISLIDGAPPPEDCSAGCSWTPDQFSISSSTTEGFPRQFVDGEFQARSLHLGSFDDRPTWDPLFGTYLDFSERYYTPVDLVSLPLMWVSSSFSESAVTCSSAEQRCRTTLITTVNFDISDVTRRIVSVPEPGTFGLLAAGLFMAGWRRRSRTPLQGYAPISSHPSQ